MKGRQTRLDQYFTSRVVVDRHFKGVIDQVSIDVKLNTIFDPFAGDGAYERGAARAGFVREVIAYDIEPKHLLIRQGNFFHATALDPKGQLPTDSLLISNPPFGRNSNVVQRVLEACTKFPAVKYISLLVPALCEGTGNRTLLAKSSVMKAKFYDLNANKGQVYKFVFLLLENRASVHKKIDVTPPVLDVIECLRPILRILPTKRRQRADIAAFANLRLGINAKPNRVLLGRTRFTSKFKPGQPVGTSDDGICTAANFGADWLRWADVTPIEIVQDAGGELISGAVVKDCLRTTVVGKTAQFAFKRGIMHPKVRVVGERLRHLER